MADSALMQETDDETLNFGEEDELDSRHRFKHPLAVLFHLVFRVFALVAYLFCGWFSSSFITNFVLVVIFLSMDFWTVKNITGRLLVGLRWWNHVDDDGKSHWIYESRKMVVLVGIIMNGANLYGYTRCKLGSKRKLSSVASNFLGAQILRNMLSSATGSASKDKKSTELK
ncbi:hypothetical protein ScPMuIL_003548 [Solemya velum]